MSDELSEYVGHGPSILMVTTPNCPFCRAVRAHCEKVGPEYPDVRFVEVSAPDHPELATMLKVRSAPTLLAFSEGVELTRLNGSAGEADVRRLFAASRGEARVRRYTISTENRVIRIGAGLALLAAGIGLGNPWLIVLGIPLIGFGLYDRVL